MSAWPRRQRGVVTLALSAVLAGALSSSQRAQLGAGVYPAFAECSAHWLDMDDTSAVVYGSQPWGRHNHLDGHHAWPNGRVWNGSAWTGAFNDFNSCMQRCIRRDGCVMFHYIDMLPWFPCGLPSAGLPGRMVPAPGGIPPQNVSVYTLGFCDCPGCCSNVVVPRNGSMGSCAASGRLSHGASCELRCQPGFQVSAGNTTVVCGSPGLILRTGGTSAVTCTACGTGTFAAGDGRPCVRCAPPRRAAVAVEASSSIRFASDYDCSVVVVQRGCDFDASATDMRLRLGTTVADICPRQCACVGARYAGPICRPRQYVAVACAVGADTVLRNCSVPCAPGSGERVPCEPGDVRRVGTDRVCEVCTATGTAFSSTNVTWSPGGEDEPCRNCTACGAGAREVTPCTAASDAVCEACAPGKFSLDGRYCTDCTVCPVGHGETTHCTPATNSVCAPCTAIGVYSGFWSAGGLGCSQTGGCSWPEKHSNNLGAVCTPCTVCPAGKFVTAACTAANDTECTRCPYNPPSFEALYSDPGSMQCSQCDNACTAGFNEDVSCRAETNRACSACAAGQFATGSSVREVHYHIVSELVVTMEMACLGWNRPVLPSFEFVNDTSSATIFVVNSAACFGFQRPNVTVVTTTSTRTTTTVVTTKYAVKHPPDPCRHISPRGGFVVCRRAGLVDSCVPRVDCVDRTHLIDSGSLSAMRQGSFTRSSAWTQIGDLSTGQPAWASSSAFGTVPSSANDGAWGREHMNQPRHHSSRGDNEWWAVHLRAPTVDPVVTIYARICCTVEFSHTLRVYIGNSNFTSAKLCVVWDDVTDRSLKSAVCSGAGTRVFVAGSGYLQLPEVVVTGVPLLNSTVDVQVNISATNSTDLLRVSPQNNHTSVRELATKEMLAPSLCKPWTECSFDYEFEAVAPSVSSDRLCRTHECTPGCDSNADCTLIGCNVSVNATTFVCQMCNMTADNFVAVHRCQDSLTSLALGRVETFPGQDVIMDRKCICREGYYGNGIQCLKHSVCHGGHTFMLHPPTRSSDRVCVSVSSCKQFEYELVGPTVTSDRKCAACPAGTYQPYSDRKVCAPCPPATFDHDADPTTSCQTCSPGNSVTPDRLGCYSTAMFSVSIAADWATVSSNLTDFKLSVVTSVAARLNVSTDRVQVLAARAGSVVVDLELLPALNKSEPSALELLGQLQRQQIVGHCLSLSAAFIACGAACVPHLTCPLVISGFSLLHLQVHDDPCMSSPCDMNAICVRAQPTVAKCTCKVGFWGDGDHCMPWRDCHVNHTYELAPPTALVDRICVDVAPCPAGRIERTPPTYRRDRNCSLCPAGTEKLGSGQYYWQQLAPNITNTTAGNSSLSNVSVVSTNSTNLTNAAPVIYTERVIDCTACKPGKYDHDSNPATACVACAVGYTVGSGLTSCDLYNPCTAGVHGCAAQAMCNMTSPGQYSCTCLNSHWGDGAWCVPLSTCLPQVAYESVAATATSDRICLPFTQCNMDQYEQRVPTHTSDRICAHCAPGNEVVGLVCIPCGGNTYDHDQLSATACVQCRYGVVDGSRTACIQTPCSVAQNDCSSQATCIASAQAPSGRICVCRTGFYGDGQWCVPWTECGPVHTYESQPGSHDSDRVCSATRICNWDEFEAMSPSRTHDRQCDVCPPGSSKMRQEDFIFALIKEIWQTALNTIEIGLATNFFRAGGSIADAMLMLLDTRNALNIAATLSPSQFMVSPTVSTLVDMTILASAGAYGRTVCIPCRAGTYDDDASPNTACVPCSAGYEPNGDRMSCELDNPCIAGSYVHGCAVQAVCSRTQKGQNKCMCGSGFWGDGTWCRPWTACTAGVSFEVAEPSRTQDRMCAAVASCPPGTAEISPASCVPTVNPTCSSVSCGSVRKDPAGSDFCFVDSNASATLNTSMYTFQDALRVCLISGARLCTVDELVRQGQQGSHNTTVWTSDECNGTSGSPSVLTTKLFASNRTVCTLKYATAAVQCCVDTGCSSSGAPVQWNRQRAICQYPDEVAMDRVCKSCRSGSFSEGGKPCKECPTGKFDHDQSPATRCKECKVGFAVGNERTSCSLDDACEAGIHGCAPDAICSRVAIGEWTCACANNSWGDAGCFNAAGVRVPHSDKTGCESAVISANFTWTDPVAEGCYDHGVLINHTTFANRSSCVSATIVAGYVWIAAAHNIAAANGTNGTNATRLSTVLPAMCFNGTQPLEHIQTQEQCISAHMETDYTWHEHVIGGCANSSVDISWNASSNSSQEINISQPFDNRLACEDHNYSANNVWRRAGSWCDPWGECTVGYNYEVTSPNATHDRVCSKVSDCPAGHKEAKPPTYSADRVCTLCAPGRYAAPVTNAAECEECAAYGIFHDHDNDPATPCRLHLLVFLAGICFPMSIALLTAAVVPLYRNRETRRWMSYQAARCTRCLKRSKLGIACAAGMRTLRVWRQRRVNVAPKYLDSIEDEPTSQASLTLTTRAANRFLRNAKGTGASANLASTTLSGPLKNLFEKDSPPTTPPQQADHHEKPTTTPMQSSNQDQ
jgi:hypothetical protein